MRDLPNKVFQIELMKMDSLETKEGENRKRKGKLYGNRSSFLFL